MQGYVLAQFAAGHACLEKSSLLG